MFDVMFSIGLTGTMVCCIFGFIYVVSILLDKFGGWAVLCFFGVLFSVSLTIGFIYGTKDESKTQSVERVLNNN